ncbi:MAG TPA: DoxX family protein [Bryobacteraceae bacterium]|nr:DoxX family protein [Bryobacteraceae bacterium]
MLKSLEPRALSILRIIAGFLFSLHGFQKLFGAFGGIPAEAGPVTFGTLVWTAGVLECFGGLLLFLGLCTRPVAFLLCGQMAVAYFRAHAPQGFWPVTNGGELAVLYCFIFLYLSIAGAGSISLDYLICRKRGR